MPNLLPDDFVNDGRELADLLHEFQSAVDRLENDQGNISKEKDVCLASRSAFVEFAAIREIEVSFEREDANRLDQLLGLAAQLVSAPDYKDSIERRLELFRSFKLDRSDLDTADSVVDVA